MKLTKTTEWILVGALIAVISLNIGYEPLRRFLSTPVGRLIGLAVIVYVWKYVSAIIAILLAIRFIQCTFGGIEGFQDNQKTEATCTCEDGFTFDPVTKMCKNSQGAVKAPTACTCPTGYSYDATKKECTQTSSMAGPLPPTPEPTGDTTTTPAPAESTGPVTSTAPMTTPGAAQAMASTTPPPPPMTTGPAAREGFTGYPFA